jgi:hypothetical protein
MPSWEYEIYRTNKQGTPTSGLINASLFDRLAEQNKKDANGTLTPAGPAWKAPGQTH